jgi:hypothetical protein
MSRKGTKRKAEPVLEKCDNIATALKESAGLSADVITMLVDIIPHCLAQPKDKRHKFQEDAIAALDDVLKGCETAFTKQIEEARTKLSGARDRTTPVEEARATAEEKLQQDSKNVIEERQTLANATLQLRATRSALQDTQKKQEAGGSEVASAMKKKQEVQVVSDQYELLKSGAVPEAEFDKQCKSLLVALKPFDLDEAMVMVLTSSLGKPASARGEFGQMVLDQLDSKIAKKIAAQDEMIAAAEGEKREREAALPVAQSDYDDATAKLIVRAKAFETAFAAKQDDEKTLETTRKEQKDLVVQIKTLDKDLYKVEAEFDVFQEFARKAFEELKERATPMPMETETGADEDAKIAPIVEPEAITA